MPLMRKRKSNLVIAYQRTLQTECGAVWQIFKMYISETYRTASGAMCCDRRTYAQQAIVTYINRKPKNIEVNFADVNGWL